jgi:hypothetical protein
VSLRPLACWTAGSNHAGGTDACLVNVVCCTATGLCDGPIPRPEKSYRVYVCVCACVCMCVCVCVCMCVCVIECDQAQVQDYESKQARKKDGKLICKCFEFILLICFAFNMVYLG